MAALERNAAHAATYWFLSLNNYSDRPFYPPKGDPTGSMGDQKIKDLKYFKKSATAADMVEIAQAKALEFIKFLLTQKKKGNIKLGWEPEYENDQAAALGLLTASMSNGDATVYDLAETVDKLFRFEGEKEHADEILSLDLKPKKSPLTPKKKAT